MDETLTESEQVPVVQWIRVINAKNVVDLYINK